MFSLVLAVGLTGPGSHAPRIDGIAHAAPTPSFAITITTRLDARGRGTFTLRGALTDAGRISARRAVVSRKLQTAATLTGAKCSRPQLRSRSCDKAQLRPGAARARVFETDSGAA